MKEKLNILLFITSSFLVACTSQSLPSSSQNFKQASTASISCQSFNLGDNLQPQLGEGSLRFNVPVARLNNPNKGHAVVLLPVTNNSIRFFWARQDDQKQWSIAEKQTVIQFQPGQVDASPMHRLHYNAQQQKIVLFITLPPAYWQEGIQIQPVLEEIESRWGQVQPFNIRLTAQGFVHPFLGIDKGLSGNSLSQPLTEIMNQIEPGSVYVPQIYANKITLLKPSLVNRRICPLAGS